jgi:hypothetical protein
VGVLDIFCMETLESSLWVMVELSGIHYDLEVN